MDRLNRKNIVLLSAIIVFVTSITYVSTLRNDFVWDDVQLITHPLKMNNNPYAFFFGSDLYYRPFLYLSMALDYSFWHLNPFGFHLTNIIIHIVNSLLVFLLGFSLFRSGRMAAEAQQATDSRALFLSFISAIVFAVHPIHTESVAWVSGRTDMLSTLFFLLAFLSFVVYEREGRAAALATTCIFFAFSLFSKENAIAFVGVVVVYGLIAGMPKKKLLLSTTALIMVFLVYFVMRSAEGHEMFLARAGTKEAFFSSGISIENFFSILSLGAGYYFEKLILPFNLNLLPQIPTNPLYSLLSLSFIVTVGALYLKRLRLAVFLTCWIIITLSPSLLILYSQVTAAPIGERYLYLPSVGFSLLIGALLLKSNKKVMIASILVIIVAYSFSTHERLKVWKNNMTLWSDTVEKSPDSVIAHTNYGAALLDAGKFDDAKRELLVALRLKRMSFEQVSAIFNLLGVIEVRNGYYENAEEYFEKALTANPKNITAYNNVGYLYMQMSESAKADETGENGLIEKAIENFKEASRLSPNFIQPKYNLGLCYLKKGDLETSERYFNSVIELDPRSDLAREAIEFLTVIQFMKANKAKRI